MSSQTYYMFESTPSGKLLLLSDGRVITGVHWEVFTRKPQIQQDWIESEAPFGGLRVELHEYFKGERQHFTVPFKLNGTPFQRQVWKELEKIPFGQQSSYSDIAISIGRPRATRAVGTAIGSNPISIVVPCHRVLTSQRKIGGYAGGLPAKERLLAIENIAVVS